MRGEIKIAVSTDNELKAELSYPDDMPVDAAIAALESTVAMLRQKLDTYVQGNGYDSAKEAPKAFKKPLVLKDIM